MCFFQQTQAHQEKKTGWINDNGTFINEGNLHLGPSLLQRTMEVRWAGCWSTASQLGLSTVEFALNEKREISCIKQSAQEIPFFACVVHPCNSLDSDARWVETRRVSRASATKTCWRDGERRTERDSFEAAFFQKSDSGFFKI